MKRVLVTGGAGFIGSNFVHYLLQTYPEIQVVNVDKLTYAGNLENLRAIEEDDRYTFVHADISNTQAMGDLFQAFDFDTVVNFAAETHVDRSISNPGDFLNTDIFGTFTLLEMVQKKGGIRYLQISTDEVYGSIPVDSASERSPLSPSSPYSASKGGGDLLTLAYYKTYGVDALVTRAANNYGPYQYPEKLIPLFITNAIDDHPLPLYGDGSQVREWLYVEDHCRGIDTVLREGRAGQIYNIGGYCEEENRVITDEILKQLGKPHSLITRVKDRPGHDTRYSVDDTKLRALGWEPRVSLEEGLARTIAWYQNNEDWWRRLKQADYKEYYQRQYGERLAVASG